MVKKGGGKKLLKSSPRKGAKRPGRKLKGPRTKYPNGELAMGNLISQPWDYSCVNPFSFQMALAARKYNVYVDADPFDADESRALFTSIKRKKDSIILEIGPALLSTQEVVDAVLPVALRKPQSKGDKRKRKVNPRHIYEFMCYKDNGTPDFLDCPENKKMMWVDLVACQSPGIFMQSASHDRGNLPNCYFSYRENKDGGQGVMRIKAMKSLKKHEQLLGEYFDEFEEEYVQPDTDLEEENDSSSYQDDE